MIKRKLATLVTLTAALAACTATPTFQTGADAEVTFDGLTRLDGTTMDVAWARTDIDLSGYSKILLQSAGVEFRPVTGPVSGRAGSTTMRRTTKSEFALDEATKKRFKEEIGTAFREELARSDRFEVVEETGPDVLLVRGGLLDVVSRVPPEPVGRSTIYIDRVGEATLVLELRDSESDAILARAVDRRAAERTGTMMESNTVTNRAEVRRLGRRWGQLLREGLESTVATTGN